MRRVRSMVAVLAVAGALCGGGAAPAQTSAPVAEPARAPSPPIGEMKPLGRDRYQIGHIVLDKRARKFTVPGRVHVVGRPLEYLATAPGGAKQYETLLELDASGSEFNLACILLGLERDPNQAPFYQFSQPPVTGPRVDITVSWRNGNKRRQVSAAEALVGAGSPVKPESVVWVYTGSIPAQHDGQFAADVAGTLVGFVHDANSIIESSLALGVGAYGSVSGNVAVLPPVETPIELTVAVARKDK